MREKIEKRDLVTGKVFLFFLMVVGFALALSFQQEPIEKHSFYLILDGLFIYLPLLTMVVFGFPIWLFLWTSWKIIEYLLLNTFALIFHGGFIHYHKKLLIFRILGFYTLSITWWNIRQLPPFNLAAPFEIGSFF